MSASTQTMSAQVSGGIRSPRGRVGSSTGEGASLHLSLGEMLASINLSASTTVQQLYNLLLKLDDENLRYATGITLHPAQDSMLDVNSVVELALHLSGPLSQCGHPGTSFFQELQLRALISSLALLQHKRVHSLDPEVFDKLRLKNISARFQKIAFQVERRSGLADRIRYAPNVYLAQLAAQYASFFNRGDSPWPSIVGPIVDIFYSALSAVSTVFLFKERIANLELQGTGNYGRIRDIVSGLNQLLNIWRRPRTKYQALCAVQEYTRLVTSLGRESATADSSSELPTAAAALATALIDKVDEILAEENGAFPSELARRWHLALAFFSRGPPDLDQGYYYYGLLDCVSQLAAVSNPDFLGAALVDRVKDLIFNSVVPEFRWKAVSDHDSRKTLPLTDTSRRSKLCCRVIPPGWNSMTSCDQASQHKIRLRLTQPSVRKYASSNDTWKTMKKWT